MYKGVEYASRAEATYAKRLDLYLKSGDIKGWERQVRYPLVVNGVKVCTIVPDFRVTDYDGREWIAEVKGYSSAVWKLKRKLFEALFPNVEYVVIPAREALAL